VRRDGALGLELSARDDLTADDDVAVHHRDLRVLLDAHDGGAEVVDEHDAGLDEDVRTRVRVAARRRRRGVEDRDGARRDQRVRRDAVDVDVVDHGDVTRVQPRGQLLGAGPDPRGAVHGGARRGRGTVVGTLRRALVGALVRAGDQLHPDYRPTTEDSRSSSAWVRAVSESSWPDSMRASSRTRASAVTSRTPVTVIIPSSSAPFSPSELLVTTRCASANAATWARCVTTTTCVLRPSWARRRPTSTAARPPTPASTSSNTNVLRGASAGRSAAPPAVASATSSASMTRDSSPPDAPLPSGRSGAPGCGTSRNVTWSAPNGPGSSSGCTETTRWAPPIARPCSSFVTASASSPAPRVRSAVRTSARRASSASSSATRARIEARRSPPSSRSSRRRPASLAHCSTSSMVSPYDRVRAVSSAIRLCAVSRPAGSACRSSTYAATSVAT